MAIAQEITSALARPPTAGEGAGRGSERWVPGQEIGPYRLKQRLGEGGMGVVWLAEQLQPLQREVALKVMSGERRDAYAETWFEIERQALAQLSHPCIAQIHDAGRLPDGSLYFAMEYVPGMPLDEFQARHPLGLRDLVALFQRLCAGVQHAHQRGLIHRDLKPLNVLVQQLDGGPAPKIIDFGIAVRQLGGVASAFRVDRVIGTPAYMSLEQRQPGPEGIDARCDIYALGVMLAEAFCRALAPADAPVRVDPSAVHDVVRLELGHSAFDPQADTAALRASLRRCPRELLAIAAKAMAVDREQRYETAAAMAEDLQRWLERRPVLAMGHGRWYVLRCLVRRNRIASVAAALVLAAVLGGSAMAWYGMNEARATQALAEQRRDDAERLIQYMLGDFADKLRPIGRLDLLDSIGQEALRYLGAQDAGGDAASALSRARALRTLGEVQVTRQQFEQAEKTLESAAELLRAPAAEAGEARADWHFEAGQIAFWRGMIEYRQRRLASAEAHWRAYLADARAYATVTDDEFQGRQEVAYALSNLGTVAEAADRIEDALKFFGEAADIRRALRPGERDAAMLDLANTLSWIATARDELGQPQLAWNLAQEALALVIAFGEKHPENAEWRQREINYRLILAQLANSLGKLLVARSLLDEALSLAQADVANDTTQPRRQAMLARIALSYSRLWPASSVQGKSALQLGATALQALPASALSEREQLSLDSLLCLAKLHHDPAAVGCSLQALEALLGGDYTGAQVLGIADRAVELLLILAARDPAAARAHEESVSRLLDAVPSARRNKLRYLQLRHALLQWSHPGDAQIADLDARIQALRSSSNP